MSGVLADLLREVGTCCELCIPTRPGLGAEVRVFVEYMEEAMLFSLEAVRLMAGAV